MRKKLTPGHRPFQLKLLGYGNSYYIERVIKLEAALAKNPRRLQIDLIGEGEIPADTALLIHSIINGRSPKTRIITNARSSLQGGSVLVWLAGDTRIIRENARIFFRRIEEAEVEEPAGENESSKYTDSFSETDPEDADYVRMLKLINEFLPVKELAGRSVELPVLKQFGLVENEQLDHFLNTAFDKPKASRTSAANEAREKRSRTRAKVPASGSVKK